MSALYSTILLKHSSVSEHLQGITCFFMEIGDLKTILTSIAVVLAVSLKNNCHTCSSKTIFDSATSSIISSHSLEYSRIGHSIRKFAITWPFIDFWARRACHRMTIRKSKLLVCHLVSLFWS